MHLLPPSVSWFDLFLLEVLIPASSGSDVVMVAHLGVELVARRDWNACTLKSSYKGTVLAESDLGPLVNTE